MKKEKVFSAAKSRFLQTCDIPIKDFKIQPFTIIIFGGAGDLSQRKLVPTLFHTYKEGELPAQFAIIGFGMPQLTEQEYRALMLKALKKYAGKTFDQGTWQKFSQKLHYISADFSDDTKYKKLTQKITKPSGKSKKSVSHVIYYMAVPPRFTPIIIKKLEQHNISRKKFAAKIIVEKPFGTDYESAVALNHVLTRAFAENQIYRIDHYLGKETVQNILFFRFANSIFEPLWNHRYIDNVQITVAESIGVEHRGSFYEKAGVLRDIVQNHIMQLIGLVAMEPPVGFDADYIRDEKVKVFRSIREATAEDIDTFMVRGQYDTGAIKGKKARGYRNEEHVAPDSNTPTYIAAKLCIDNWRWAGVPFYIRTGKRMPRRVTEICIEFKQPPLRLFGRTCDVLEPNLLFLTVQPNEEISLRFGIKYPQAVNKIYPATMDFSYQDTFKTKSHPAYERLLVDCMKGDLTLFVRQDGVEAMWKLIDPITSRWESTPAPRFPNYKAGAWGPEQARALLEKDGRTWHTT